MKVLSKKKEKKKKDGLLLCKKPSYILFFVAHFTTYFSYFVFLNMDTGNILKYSQSTPLAWLIPKILGAKKSAMDSLVNKN